MNYRNVTLDTIFIISYYFIILTTEKSVYIHSKVTKKQRNMQVWFIIFIKIYRFILLFIQSGTF